MLNNGVFDRIKVLIAEVDGNLGLDNENWSVWSGNFNRDLRAAIMAGSEKEKEKFRFVFTYWQIQNSLRNVGPFEFKRAKDLMRQVTDIKREILSEEK